MLGHSFQEPILAGKSLARVVLIKGFILRSQLISLVQNMSVDRLHGALGLLREMVLLSSLTRSLYGVLLIKGATGL